MSYNNFIPEVWADTIETSLDREHVFVADCNRKYEGTVSKQGDTVRILGVGKPTITTTNKDGFTGLSSPETVEDTSVSMVIDRMSTFNYMVDDIDKRQAVGGLMEALNAEASEGLADEEDKAVAGLAKDKMAIRLHAAAVELTKDNILEEIDLALQKLYENDVKRNTKITVTMSPAIYTIFRQAYTERDTDNSDLLKNGAVSKYNGAYIKVSNNVAKVTEGGETVHLIQIKTERACAFARPMVHVEPYRPESRFSDAVKGFSLYGSKIVRPKEMFILNGYV